MLMFQRYQEVMLSVFFQSIYRVYLVQLLTNTESDEQLALPVILPIESMEGISI